MRWRKAAPDGDEVRGASADAYRAKLTLEGEGTFPAAGHARPCPRSQRIVETLCTPHISGQVPAPRRESALAPERDPLLASNSANHARWATYLLKQNTWLRTRTQRWPWRSASVHHPRRPSTPPASCPDPRREQGLVAHPAPARLATPPEPRPPAPRAPPPPRRAPRLPLPSGLLRRSSPPACCTLMRRNTPPHHISSRLGSLLHSLLQSHRVILCHTHSISTAHIPIRCPSWPSCPTRTHDTTSSHPTLPTASPSIHSRLPSLCPSPALFQ